MHSMKHILKKYPNGYAWYQKQDGSRPIYLRDAADPTIPGSLKFPGPELMQYFKHRDGTPESFFTFSGTWFAALALWEHLEGNPVEEIQFCGIRMERGHQWEYERPALHYWCGRLEEAGIKVSIPDGDSLLVDRVGKSFAASVLNEALTDGITEIDLRGVEISRDDKTEYETVHYLIGRARQRGYQVHLPPGVAVAEKLYGYETT
jgi:hypothetical protein